MGAIDETNFFFFDYWVCDTADNCDEICKDETKTPYIENVNFVSRHAQYVMLVNIHMGDNEPQTVYTTTFEYDSFWRRDQSSWTNVNLDSLLQYMLVKLAHQM